MTIDLATLDRRLVNVESRLRTMNPGRQVHPSPIWLAETRDRGIAGGGSSDYPTTQHANVFPAALIERVFPLAAGVQSLTEAHYGKDDDPAAVPAWPWVHSPHYLPRGHRLLVYYDATQDRWHALNPPAKLFGVPDGTITAATGTQPTVTPGYGTLNLYQSSAMGAFAPLLYGGSAPIQVPVLNYTTTAYTSASGILCAEAGQLAGHAGGVWWVVPVAGQDLRQIWRATFYTNATASTTVVSNYTATSTWAHPEITKSSSPATLTFNAAGSYEVTCQLFCSNGPPSTASLITAEVGVYRAPNFVALADNWGTALPRTRWPTTLQDVSAFARSFLVSVQAYDILAVRFSRSGDNTTGTLNLNAFVHVGRKWP